MSVKYAFTGYGINNVRYGSNKTTYYILDMLVQY